jgi:putative hemolysin
LHGIRMGFIFRSRNPFDTAFVINRLRQRVPLKLSAANASIVEAAYPVYLPVPSLSPSKPRIHAEVGRYSLRLAMDAADREAACRLRFKVFNIELGEGLESSYNTGLDTDRFDSICEHLIVEDKTEENPAKRVVGTYRMQSGTTAARNYGYYSEQEFCFAPYELLRTGVLELGRASIDREHRSPEVLTLLWRGIAQYATEMGLRYLIGCSSLTSKDPAEGWQLYGQLEQYCVSPEFATEPTAAFVCPTERKGGQTQSLSGSGESNLVKVPKLLRTYLAIGAQICAPPAWDREFGTIDFLTLLDLKAVSPSARHRFLAPLTQ